MQKSSKSKAKKEELKKAGNKSYDEIVKIVRSIRKELDEHNLPAYTPRKNGRIL